MRRTRLLLTAALAIAACTGGAGGDGTSAPIRHDTASAKVDPFATIFIENVTTAGASPRGRHTTFVIDLAIGDTLVPQGSVAPGERACTSLSGFVGERLIQVVGVGDTVGVVWNASPARRDSAALNIPTTGWAGLLRLTTGVFDPLVSADTSRGHSAKRPVKWRWTLGDTLSVLREDSTTVCAF